MAAHPSPSASLLILSRSQKPKTPHRHRRSAAPARRRPIEHLRICLLGSTSTTPTHVMAGRQNAQQQGPAGSTRHAPSALPSTSRARPVGFSRGRRRASALGLSGARARSAGEPHLTLSRTRKRRGRSTETRARRSRGGASPTRGPRLARWPARRRGGREREGPGRGHVAGLRALSWRRRTRGLGGGHAGAVPAVRFVECGRLGRSR